MLTLRRTPWLAVVTVAHLPWLACTQHTLERPEPRPEQMLTDVFVQNPQLKLDIVFSIDNSDSMVEEQANLIANFRVFMQVLQDAIPADSTLDAHIGVVSSDLGVALDGVGGCNTAGGDNGRFQGQPRGACTSSPSGSYIKTAASEKNFTGTIDETFSCIAALGHMGCGFEHQLAAVRRALGGDPDYEMPPENAGFLRRDARLGVIIITDEDDCSAPNGSDLFTPDTSVYGPLNSYRCNEYGHLCGGAPPPRAVATGLTCASNETDSTHLIKIDELVQFFRGLKPNPDLLRVAAITGPPSPYGTAPEPMHGNAIEPVPSCTSAFGNADPAVRLDQFVRAFGSNGLFETICLADLGPAMKHIAESLVTPILSCVKRRLYDLDTQTPGIQADCTVEESHVTDDAALPLAIAVESCDDAGGQPPCWRLVPDGRCDDSPDGVAIQVDHGATPPPPNTNTKWTCRTCPDLDDPACAR